MIHTVKIDDTTRNGKRILEEIRKYRTGVVFENPAVTGIVPEGYMTAEEFEKKAMEKVNKFCNEHGIL